MMKIFGAGVALSFLLVVPPWPFLNCHPLPWLEKPAADAAKPAGAAAGRAQKPARGKGAQQGKRHVRERACLTRA